MDFILSMLPDFSKMFQSTRNPIVINDYILQKDFNDLVELLCDVSNNNNDSVCSCFCGNLSANYYEGVICPKCGIECKSNIFNKLYNNIWIRVPDEIGKVLHTHIYLMIDKWIGKVKKEGFLDLYLDTSRPKEPIFGTPFFSGQGYVQFYENFDTIINYWAERKKGKTSREMVSLINRSRDILWIEYLPTFSKIIQPIIRVSEDMRYADEDIKELMQSLCAIRSLYIGRETMRLTTRERHINNYFYKIHSTYVKYINKIEVSKLPSKHDLIRKHLIGSRIHLTGRTVAIPITEPHMNHDIHLPWVIGVTMYRYHIMSHLMHRHDINAMEAYNRVFRAINIYDFEIDQIMQGMIKKASDTIVTEFPKLRSAGLPILVNRNPSLKVGSTGFFFVAKIKPNLKIEPVFKPVELLHDETDLMSFMNFSEPVSSNDLLFDERSKFFARLIADRTISVSDTIVKPPNLDFDGDNLNNLPINELDAVSDFIRMHPAFHFISDDHVDRIDTTNISLSTLSLARLVSWIEED